MCCRCFIVGCNSYNIRLSYPPDGLPEPPRRIMCYVCGISMSASYYRRDTWCSFCFIPLCRVTKGSPYLACNQCGTSLGPGVTRRCRNCDLAVGPGFRYCAECGQSV